MNGYFARSCRPDEEKGEKKSERGRTRERETERKQRETRKGIEDKKKGDREGASQELSLITGLDLIMVATSASAALASAVASNELAANGPDMDEKLSQLNARSRERTTVFRYYSSFKAPPGTNAIYPRALCFRRSLLPLSPVDFPSDPAMFL